MKTSLGRLLVLTTAFAAGLAAQTATYRIAPAAGTEFELIVKKTGFLSGKKHVFAFPRYTGELRFNPAAPENASITLRIEASSIQCKDDWVSESDRKKVLAEATEKMLIANKHKELVFQSTSIRQQVDGSFLVRGDLQIRGVPKPVGISVKMQPESGGTIRFDGRSTIDMTAWGLKPPKAMLGAIGTEKEMLVQFEVMATKAAEESE